MPFSSIRFSFLSEQATISIVAPSAMDNILFIVYMVNDIVIGTDVPLSNWPPFCPLVPMAPASPLATVAYFYYFCLFLLPVYYGGDLKIKPHSRLKIEFSFGHFQWRSWVFLYGIQIHPVGCRHFCIPYYTCWLSRN